MRVMVFAFGGLLVAMTGAACSAEFDVGRVKLRTYEDGWETIGVRRRGVPYTGDRSGQIQLDTRQLLLGDRSGNFRAALIVGASRGVGAVRMSWSMNCQSGTNTYALANTRQNAYDTDCLKVTGPLQSKRYLELAAPDLLAELIARNVVLPRTVYVVSAEAGLDNGTFSSVQGVFAGDLALPANAGSQHDLPPSVRPEAVAWGKRLAESVNASLRSISGTLELPPVDDKGRVDTGVTK
jgi:hypothetical protein